MFPLYEFLCDARYFVKFLDNEKAYLPDINTASYSPRPDAIIRCFKRFRDGRTENAGGSGKVKSVENVSPGSCTILNHEI